MSILIPQPPRSMAKSVRSWEEFTRWGTDKDNYVNGLHTTLAEVSRQLAEVRNMLGGGQQPTTSKQNIVFSQGSITPGNVAAFIDKKSITDGGAAAANAVAASSTFGTDNVIIRADGTSRNAQSSGMEIDDSALRIRDTGGEFIGMASTTAKTTQGGGAADGTEQTLHSEAMKSGILDVAGRVLHVRASGTWTADATPPGTWILALKYGSTAVWQFTATMVAGPYTDQWSFECDVITTSSGNVRAYGFWDDANGGVPTSRVPSDLAIARTPTTSGAVTVALTITWSGADAGSNFLCEMCTMDLGGLTA